MSFTTERQAPHPTTGKSHLLERAVVWVVDATRGDIYVVAFEDEDVLVQLLDGGIANRPDRVLGEEMDVMVDRSNGYRRVVALPVEGGYGWRLCRRLRD